jgi:hypothetical protein
VLPVLTSPSRTGRLLLASTLAVALAASGSLALGSGRPAAAQVVPGEQGGPTLAWQQLIPGGGIRESSPVLANLGSPSVVVGAQNGKVYAFSVATGRPVPGWPVATANPINSSPAAADTSHAGTDQVFIGSGTADAGLCSGGGVYAFASGGRQIWRDTGSDPNCGGAEPFHSSPAIGDTTGDGVPKVTIGALGLNDWSFSAPTGVAGAGWPYYTDDTTFSSPALAELSGTGVPDIVVGGDSSPGGTIDHRGGLVRAVTGEGQTLWQFFTDEIVRSSPAVGDITGTGKASIVFGTGDYWVHQPGGSSDATKIFALDTGGHLQWSRDLGGITMGSPALADVGGTGVADVVMGTAGTLANPAAGTIWVLDGSGRPLPNWAGHPSAGGAVIGGVTTADLNGDGAQDLLVPTGGGFYAYDGRSAQLLFGLDEGQASFQNSALVTQDAPGVVGITVAGTRPDGTGVVEHYVMPAGSHARLGTIGWPMFHHDPRHTGNLSVPPLTASICGAKVGTTEAGYWFAAADGSIFSFCGASFHGSGAGAVTGPVVAMTSTPSGRGYWLATSSGGVSAFGDAGFFGSASGRAPGNPVVGMARTGDGRGYWLATASGAVYAFGDAPALGSTGPLNRPVVGISATVDGRGYWLVASDGGIFSFGDAKFFGSTGAIHLSQPIVALAPTKSGHGYWFVASDGGIFAYGDATFMGSTGALKLNSPIAGMAATADGHGYWLVSADGGVFTFGDAPYLGSGGGSPTQPITSMAVPPG